MSYIRLIKNISHTFPARAIHFFICILFFTAIAPRYVAGQDFGYAVTLTEGVGEVLSILVPVLLALAFLMFVWGLVLFIAQSGDEKKIEEGKKKMLWGVLALFVITAIWGIMSLLQNMFGVDGDAVEPPDVPQQQ
ncbi:MAG: hypothetical protein KBD24_03375 [Candidatus Pacebacteria bacterium]|nr:hypothetical protein [Candidatus Paceibacterota bacterium]